MACLATAHPDASLLQLDSLRYSIAGNSEPGYPLFLISFVLKKGKDAEMNIPLLSKMAKTLKFFIKQV